MKYIIYTSVIFLFFSCKKKEQQIDNSQTTTPQVANYQPNLQSNLILTYNGGGFDTSFVFSSGYVKMVGAAQTQSVFPSTNYNGYITNAANNFNGQVFNSSNFIQLSAISNWSVNCLEFGDFQHSDSIPLPSITTSLTSVPSTFDINQGIPIKISGLTGASRVYLYDLNYNVYSNGLIRNYNWVTFPTISGAIYDTIRDSELSFIPINSTFTLSIDCPLRVTKTINGNYTFIIKRTTYNYPIKRIN